MKTFMGVKTGECFSHTWVIVAWSEISLNSQIKVFISIYPTEKSLKYNPISGDNERISQKADITWYIGLLHHLGSMTGPVFIIWSVKIKESASRSLPHPRDGSYKYAGSKQRFSFLFVLLSTERMREESIPVRLAGTFDTHCPFQLKESWSSHSQRWLIIQKKKGWDRQE